MKSMKACVQKEVRYRDGMRKYIYIAIGGAVGAVLRAGARGISALDFNGKIPYDTLLINIIGCFLLALFLTVAFEILEIDADIRMGFSTGLLGAFTTFSTFCRETVELIWAGQTLPAFIYAALSIGLGFLGAFFGVVLARKFVAGLANRIAEGS